MTRTDWEALMREEVANHIPDENIAGVLSAMTKGFSARTYWVGVGEQHLALLRIRGGTADHATVLAPEQIVEARFSVPIGGISPAALVASNSALNLKLRLADGPTLRLQMNSGSGAGGALATLRTSSSFQTEGVTALIEWVYRNVGNGS